MQPSLAHDVHGVEVHHPCLTGYNHHAALCDGVAAGTQPVAVEHAAGIASVGEQQGSRSVPRLHQNTVVLVECLQVVADGVLVVETLWNQNGHGLWQAQSAHDEEFKHVVQTGRVAHALLYNRTYVGDVSQSLAVQHTFACLHPSTVAAYGVDFSIMSQEAERLCQFPFWECVGAETRVNQCQSAGKIGTGQIVEIAAQLAACQHALINDVSAAE